MKKCSNLIILIFFTVFTTVINCHAFGLDESIDNEIRKNYKDTKLIDDTEMNNALSKSIKFSHEKQTTNELPALPDITKTSKKTITSNSVKTTKKDFSPKVIQNIKIDKNTTLDVISTSSISDKLSKGCSVKFIIKKSISDKTTSVPNGTIFYGKITDIHQPQITCNGGLVSVQIQSLQYYGNIIPVKAYIIKAGNKNIFFNDIKGKRVFLKTLWQKGNWGRSLFNQMLKLTINLGSETSTLILAPFPFMYGSICFGLNTLTAPVTAFFSKGGHVSIPAGTDFKIKFMEDIQYLK